MKNLKKYWPALLLLIVWSLTAVCVTACSPQSTDNPTTEDFVENDPEQVTMSSEHVSSIIESLPGFNETTDGPEAGSSSTETSAKPTETDGSETSDTNTGTTDSSTSSKPTVSTSTDTNTDIPTDTTEDTPGTSTDTDVTPEEPIISNVAEPALGAALSLTRTKFKTAPKEFYINGFKCALDESSNTYCFAISERAVGVSKTYAFTGTFEGKKLSVVFPLGNFSPTKHTLSATANQTFKIFLFTDDYYGEYNLRISTMPVMVIETENRTSLPTNNDKKTTLYCTIEIYNPDGDIEPGDEFVASYATIHNRGASSLSYPKKSLKIELQKFENKNGTSVMTERNKRLMGMRDDDDWILDACYADPTMIHNKMAYNLWEEIGGDTNPNALLAGPHCEFVEVIMNGKYHGLFLLVEPVDEKQMGVQKSSNTEDGSHGVFIKTTSWVNTKFDAIKGTPLKSDGTAKSTWEGLEMKYPENGVTKADWDPIWELMEATVNGDDATFTKAAQKYLDKENIVNYWILISVTFARDNAGKNICWSIANLSGPDAKMYINAWDMDNTFGYRYGAASKGPSKDNHTKNPNYADAWFVLLRRYLECNVDGAADYLQTRWKELTRIGAPCSVVGLYMRVDKEMAYLESCGAFEREQQRWPATSTVHASLPRSMETEIEYAKQWIAERIPVVIDIVKSYQ